MAKDPIDKFNLQDQDPGMDAEGVYIPPDEPYGVKSFGTTAAEERLGEGFAKRTKHLQPENIDNPGYDEYLTGQLVQPGDEDVDRVDVESNVIAWEEGRTFENDLSAEEAAMHFIEDKS